MFIRPAKRPISADDAHELHQTHNCRSNQWEEAERKPVVIPYDAPTFDTPNAVLHVNPDRCQAAILRTLLFCQAPSWGLLVGDAHPGNSLVRQVALLLRTRVLLLYRALFIPSFVGSRPSMPRVKVEDFTLGIGDHLTREGVALLLARE